MAQQQVWGNGSVRLYPDQVTAKDVVYYVDGKRTTLAVAKGLRQYGTAADRKRPARDFTEADGWRLLRLVRDQRAAGRYVDPIRRKMTVAQLLDNYDAALVAAGAKSIRQIRTDLKCLREAFGELAVERCTLDVLRAWAQTVQAGPGEGRRKAYAKGTVVNRLAYLHAAFEQAVTDGKLTAVQIPPFPALGALKNAREGFFEQPEVDALLAVLPADHRAVVTWAYLTGWRKAEILSLEWAWVDWTDGLIRLPDTKSGKGRVVPLVDGAGVELPHGRLLRALYEARAQAGALSPWVFQRGGHRLSTNIQRWWLRAITQAGLPAEKLFHDFRRTAARDLTRAGVPTVVAMKITGHETDAIFRRYQIMNVDDVRRAFTQLAGMRGPMAATVDDLTGPATKPAQKLHNLTERRLSPAGSSLQKRALEA